jgi:hypothetical protein
MARCWGDCSYVGRFLHQTGCCLSVWREKSEQGQPVLLLLLLLAVAAVRLWREGSRRCLRYRITWL